MSEMDDCEIINKNYKELNIFKFPISGGIFPDMLFDCKRLNHNEK